jgi:DNA replication protein DnaC
LSVGFTTAAALVHELIEARDEKRLLRLQRQLAGCKLLSIDLCGVGIYVERFGGFDCQYGISRVLTQHN